MKLTLLLILYFVEIGPTQPFWIYSILKLALTRAYYTIASGAFSIFKRFVLNFTGIVKNGLKYFFSPYSGNVVGVAPYAVGAPSCINHGMYPSSRYSGLCVSTQTVYTPTNDVITQNTYTFKSERINPTVYRTIKTAPSYSFYNHKQSQQSSAIQTYQQALQAYQNPNQSYESAQQNYQLALQAYSAAYSSPQTQQPTPSYTYRQPSNSYDWSLYFG